MTHIATIEIDEIDTEVSIEFNTYFGQVEVSKITDLATGNAVGIEIPDQLYTDLEEQVADMAAERVGRYNLNL